jgi:hypothetical protein
LKLAFTFAALLILCAGILMVGYYGGDGNREHSNPRTPVVGSIATKQPSYSASDVGIVPAPTSPEQEANGPPAQNVTSPKDHSRRMATKKLGNAKLPANNQTAYIPPNSLPTGTEIIADRAKSGRGELEAKNGSGYDACVIIVDADAREVVRRVRIHYIKAYDSDTLRHLDPGDYKVLFATGIDWNEAAERFNRDASYYEFGNVISFRESRDLEKLHYDHFSITLNPVPDGNVRSRHISEAEFHVLTGKR